MDKSENTDVGRSTSQTEEIIPSEDSMGAQETPKKKFTKKKLAVLGVIFVVVVIIVIALLPSKFEKVESECVSIAGVISSGKGYFIIDTYPDSYENADEFVKATSLPRLQENALKAIVYANEELGFNGAVYSRMKETTALMGRQVEENDKYKVSWTYHPDDGLKVTYEKK